MVPEPFTPLDSHVGAKLASPSLVLRTGPMICCATFLYLLFPFRLIFHKSQPDAQLPPEAIPRRSYAVSMLSLFPFLLSRAYDNIASWRYRPHLLSTSTEVFLSSIELSPKDASLVRSRSPKIVPIAILFPSWLRKRLSHFPL